MTETFDYSITDSKGDSDSAELSIEVIATTTSAAPVSTALVSGPDLFPTELTSVGPIVDSGVDSYTDLSAANIAVVDLNSADYLI